MVAVAVVAARRQQRWRRWPVEAVEDNLLAKAACNERVDGCMTACDDEIGRCYILNKWLVSASGYGARRVVSRRHRKRERARWGGGEPYEKGGKIE